MEDGTTEVLSARKEVILSAGAVGSPQILLLSGIGPKSELESVGVACRLDSPHVGKHLKDHLYLGLVFPAPGVGISMTEIGLSMGPDVMRAPDGPLPADPADDVAMSPELLGIKQEAERRLAEWVTTGHGLVSSSLYDASAWFSTGLGDPHTQDAQIGFFVCGDTEESWRRTLRMDPERYFDDTAVRLGPRSRDHHLVGEPRTAPQ